MQQTVRRTAILLMSGDVAVFIFALLIALVLRHGAWPSHGLFIDHLVPFGALSVVWVAVFFIAGLYDTHVTMLRTDIPNLVLKAQVINMLLAVLFFFLVSVGITPKTTLALYLIVSTTLLVIWRLFLFPRMSLGTQSRAVIVGSGAEAKEIGRTLNGHPQLGWACVAVLDTRVYTSAASLEEKLAEVIRVQQVDSIIADMSDEYAKRLASVYYDMAFLQGNLRFIRLHELYEQLFHRIPVSLVGKTWFLENISTETPHRGYVFLKRLCDVVGALVLLIPCIVLFPLIALVMKLYDTGTVFYKAERVGQYNRPIWIYKFRSMTGMDSGATLDTKHTVTPLGRVLRKTRLDELPQLWNILRGDLSFVGPRPETPARSAVYAECIPYYNMRHLIKPGLSGWAQINNFDVPRGEVDINRTIDKLSFDLFYLKRHSLFLDFEIILKTIKTMLLRSGT